MPKDFRDAIARWPSVTTVLPSTAVFFRGKYLGAKSLVCECVND